MLTPLQKEFMAEYDLIRKRFEGVPLVSDNMIRLKLALEHAVIEYYTKGGFFVDKQGAPIAGDGWVAVVDEYAGSKVIIKFQTKPVDIFLSLDEED